VQASFLRLQTAPDLAETHQMHEQRFLLAIGLLLAASFGDSKTSDSPGDEFKNQMESFEECILNPGHS